MFSNWSSGGIPRSLLAALSLMILSRAWNSAISSLSMLSLWCEFGSFMLASIFYLNCDLQRGHSLFFLNHDRIQSLWNMCFWECWASGPTFAVSPWPQSKTFSISPFSKGWRQMLHSSAIFWFYCFSRSISWIIPSNSFSLTEFSKFSQWMST